MSDKYYAKGVSSLINSAVSGKSDEDCNFLLTGDLNQMGIQDKFLKDQGLVVKRWDVYPGFRTQKEYDEAITLIWQHKVEGWWHYQKRLVELGICTEKEFKSFLMSL